MRESIILNIAMLLVSVAMIGVTVYERLNAPLAHTVLVILSIVSVFTIALAISNIKCMLLKSRRRRIKG